MPEVIDLGYCPRCGEDLIETSVGFIKHVKFCLICRDLIKLDEFWSKYYIDIAERTMEVIKSCQTKPNNSTEKQQSPNT
ncbi:hypothetical protein ES703_54697 [subsurface metagenome]